VYLANECTDSAELDSEYLIDIGYEKLIPEIVSLCSN